ncbi:MAG: hypothetical protein RMI91_06230 [Gemmatales bacterium]|nr:hypothetical protein [Gemmatales bacterium]MDW7994233.1 hypothetical protein [Gemmatales bacterium]
MYRLLTNMFMALTVSLFMIGCGGGVGKPQLNNLSPQQRQEMDRTLQASAEEERQRLAPAEAQRYSLNTAEEEERRRR